MVAVAISWNRTEEFENTEELCMFSPHRPISTNCVSLERAQQVLHAGTLVAGPPRAISL